MKKISFIALILIIGLLPIFAASSMINSNEFWQSCPTIDQVITEVSNCSDINETDEFLVTPLMRAVTYEASVDVIDLLLNSGADVNAINSYGENSLICALATNEDLAIATLLVEKGANININQAPFYNTALSTVLQRNPSIDFVEFVIDNGFDLNQKSLNLFNAYELIAMYADIDLISELSNKYLVDDSQINQMLIPSIFNDSKVFAFLLENGADVEYESPYLGSLFTALTSMCDDSEIFTVFIDKLNLNHEEKLELLIATASKANNPEVLEAIVNEGVSLTERNEKGENAIDIVFINNKNKEIFDYIIDAVDLAQLMNTEEQYNVLPYYALCNDEPSLIPYFQEKFGLNEAEMYDLFSLSSANPDYTIFNWFIKQGYDPLETTDDLTSLFGYAALTNSNLDNIEYLVKTFKPTQEIINEMLVYAIFDNPNIEVIKYLMGLLDDLNQENKVFDSPLVCACRYADRPEVVELLLNSGVDAKLRIDGKLPRDYARSNDAIYLTSAYWKLVYKTYN